MRSALLLLVICFENGRSVDFYEDDAEKPRSVTLENVDFEPVVTKERKIILTKNLNCDDFSKYAMHCTMEAAMIYNCTRRSPPMPGKIDDWCRAIRHLTNCAIDWNSECKDVTESLFNRESLKGLMHVVNSVCDDEWFIARYDEVPQCIDATTDGWEACYTDFTSVVDRLKNVTQEWTHYVPHFHLCCARTRFRRCTLDVLFDSAQCAREHAILLQKFSVIVSEGYVYQDCDSNMMYVNCTGGDPRPSGRMLARLMNAEAVSTANVLKQLYILWCTLLILTGLIK